MCILHENAGGEQAEQITIAKLIQKGNPKSGSTLVHRVTIRLNRNKPGSSLTVGLYQADHVQIDNTDYH